MPQALLTAAVFAAQAIGSAASAVLVATASAGTAGLAAAASLASIAYTSYATKKAEADARKNAAQAPRDITVRSATEPAKIIYGTARTSGPIVYTNTAPTPGTNDNNTLWTVIALCNHEVEDITDIWLDGDEITASQINWGGTGGVTSGKYGPIGSNQVTNFYKRLGTATQTHVSELSTAFTDWSSSYQGKNVAYIVSAFELGTATGEGVWAQGAPTNIRAVVKGKKVYDPRKDSTQTGGSGSHRLATPSTWEWSDNPALCLADYLFDARLGLGAEGVTYDDIDWDMVADAADVCDATVSIPGGSEKRFTCNGALSTGSTYAENIKALMSSMNGQVTWSGGKYRIRAGAYEAHTHDFTEDDVVGEIQIQPERTRTQRFNTVRGTYVDPESDYVPTEFIPVNDSNLQSGRDDGQKLIRDIKLPMTNSEYMAQRLAYKIIGLNDQQLRCIVPMNWKAMKVAVGDRIRLSVDELSWSNKVFRVDGWSFDPETGFNLTLQEDSSSAYDDPGVSDYSTRTLAGTVTFADQPVPSPSNLSATAEEEAVLLEWANPGRGSGYDEIAVYASATSAWSGASEIGRTRGTSFRHELARNTQRYYWVRAIDVDGEESIRNPNSDTSSIQATAGEIDFGNLGGATKPADNATNNGSTINTDGDIAGSIDTATTGDIHGGQTGYDSGTGYFLGYDTNAYKFSIGNSSGDKLTFDGSNLAVTGNITADGGSIGGLTIASDKVYLGSGTFNHTNTGFYVDDTGQFSLKDKLAFYPNDSTLRVKGNIEADVISVTDSLQVAGNLVASSLEDGSITSAMLTEEAINAIFDRIATNLGGTNGDYKETTGNFTTSGGTILVGTSSDKFDHGDQDVVVELVENYGFSQTTDYTGAALDATVQFQVSADGTFTDLTSLNRTQTFTLGKYDLSAYYGSQTYIWYYGPRLLTTTYTAAQLSDNTDYQFRAVISSVGNAFTGITYPVTLEVNEGVQGVTSAGGDANTLDGLDSTQFLRSDQSDTMNGSLTITGDLTVNGTTVTLNTATLDVEDKNITLNYGAGDTSGSANGAGITIQDAVNSSTDATILWDTTNDRFNFSNAVNVETGGIRSVGATSDGTAYSGIFRNSGGSNLLLVRNDGVVQVTENYFYASNSAGAYFTGAIRARGGIVNDQGDLLLNDNVNVNGTLTIDHSTFGEGLVLERQDTTNSSSIKFTNTAGTAGILYGRHSDNELVWRDGTTTNNFMLWHQGNDGPNSGLDADTCDGQHLGTSASVTFNRAEASRMGVNNTSATSKYGFSLYNGYAEASNPTYGLMFTGTSGSGTHGAVSGDWATYFTMNGSSGRGWIFRNQGNTTNVASISNAGVANFASTVLTDTYSGGTGDFTNIATPQLKIVAEGTSYWRIPHVSGSTSVSGVYNYETGKDVFWGEPGDTGVYRFRGRDLRVEDGKLIMGAQTALEVASNYLRINQSSYQTYGVWFGSSDVGSSSGTFHWGSNGTASTARVIIEPGTYDGTNVIKLDGADGHVTGRKLEAVNSTTANELMLLHATSDRFADAIFADNGGSIRLRQDYGKFQVYSGGSANSTNASGAANRFEVTASGINVPSGGIYVGGNETISSARHLFNLGGQLRSDNSFDLLTMSGNAQTIQTGGVSAGTNYSSTPVYTGEFNAVTGYRLNNTRFLDANRYMSQINDYAVNAGHGQGYGFWGSGLGGAYRIYMSQQSNSTYGGRVTGETSSDYNMYFKMQSGTNRGFVFRDNADNYFSINPSGFYSEVPGIISNKINIRGDHSSNRLHLEYRHENTDSHGSNGDLLLWTSEPGITYDCSGIGANIHPSGQYYGRADNANPYGLYMRFDVNDGDIEFWNTTGSSGSTGGQGTRRAYIDVSGGFHSTDLEVAGVLTLSNSSDRSGLLDIQNTGQSWTGVQFTRSAGDHWSVMGNDANFGLYDDQNGEWILLHAQNGGTSLFHNGVERVYTVADGLQLSQYLIANQGSSNRNSGYYGVYSPSKLAHIWSMGTAYKIAADGTSASNIYGLTYSYNPDYQGTGNNPGAVSGLGHQMQWRTNGTTQTAIGTGVYTIGNVTAYSDRRVKANLEVIPDALTKVCKLNGYTYERTDLGFDEATGEKQVVRQAGVIAQEVLEVLPEVVTGSEEHHYGVAYGNMVSLLIEAIKELKGEVDSLKSQLKEKDDGDN